MRVDVHFFEKKIGYCSYCVLLQNTSAILILLRLTLNGWCIAPECGIDFMGVIPLCAAPEMTHSIILVLDFHISVEKVIP